MYSTYVPSCYYRSQRNESLYALAFFLRCLCIFCRFVENLKVFHCSDLITVNERWKLSVALVVMHSSFSPVCRSALVNTLFYFENKVLSILVNHPKD